MRVCFVSGQSVESFLKGYDGEKADIFLFGFNGIGEVCYESELHGKTKFFERTALLSKKSQAIVISGCTTDARGHKRKSAIVAEKGVLKGVSDALYSLDEKVSVGATLRVYETSVGRMGVVVAEDLHFPEVFKALTACGSDFIVCPYAHVRSALQSALLRSCGYFYGTPIFFCAEGYAMIANAKGEMEFASPLSPAFVDVEYRAEYRLIQSRKKGIR